MRNSYDDKTDLMILDIKLENGPLEHQKMGEALFHGLLSVNCKLEDLTLLMALIDQVPDLVDLQLQTFERCYQDLIKYRKGKPVQPHVAQLTKETPNNNHINPFGSLTESVRQLNKEILELCVYLEEIKNKQKE